MDTQPRDQAPPALSLVLGGGSLLHQVARELRTAVEAHLAPHDVTAQQAAVLLLAAQGRTSPNQLTTHLGTDTAGMTRLLDRLEAKGLIIRRKHPTDRRSLVIALTPRGQALLPRLAPPFGTVSAAMLSGFTDQDVNRLTGMLERMLTNLREHIEAAPDGRHSGN
ncbi:MarR family transcriptional regulator [Spongiactinospora sp. TRM90649]|uniref:MarR family winged helix-turn-helix transcriptional regulator n=1 Tax=Spongiactinospora sp. TRM90649 TaxID=3031114 RepID=UPI0023F65983|nr:MarR family transcriptional regulator [Spongiactinospora sp. TRM90649]MDF5758034.1 MarR family transcriptional regulator [Spongiactinospora sp. TRM90649]